MENEKVSLGEVLNFKKKTSRRASEGGLTGNYLFFTSSPKQKLFLNEFDFEVESLILGTGGKPSLHYCNKPFSTSADCIIINSQKKSILIKYIYYYLLSNFHILEEGFKGSGLKHISVKYIKDIKINIPSLETQIEKINLFEKIEKTKNKIEKSEKSIDDYVKNIFYNMFGNFKNEQWERLTLPEIVKEERHSIKRGPFGGSLKKEIFVNDGFLVYEQRHAIHNDFEYARYYITEEKYNELIIFKVVPGDLIISCSGVTLGRISEIPKNAKAGIINQALLKISLDNNKVNNEYFKFLFRSEEVQEILFNFSRGSGIPNFPSISEIKDIKFPIPSIELQERFAKIVFKSEKIKEMFNINKKKYSILFSFLLNKELNNEVIELNQ